ncbi:MAG: hypothetical protein WC383_12375, partial [Gammaproteobacteria bacterium]
METRSRPLLWPLVGSLLVHGAAALCVALGTRAMPPPQPRIMVATLITAPPAEMMAMEQTAPTPSIAQTEPSVQEDAPQARQQPEPEVEREPEP